MLKRKIQELRQQSEEVRLKALTRFTFAAGIVLGLIWLAIFLPLQLSLNPKKDQPIIPAPEASATPAVDAAVTTLPPRPTVAPTAKPTTAPVEVLPSSDNQVSPSPTSTPK